MTINFANDTTTIVMNALASKDSMVQKMLYRAQAIEALIDYLKSHPEGVCTRELNRAIVEGIGGKAAYHAPSAETLLEWFDLYDWVGHEIRTEETIEVEYEGYIGDHRDDRITFNDDNTITINWYNHVPTTVYNYEIMKGPWGMTHVKGKQKVQVKRKYWFWKA